MTLRERIEHWNKLYDDWYEYDKAGLLLNKAANLIEELEKELDSTNQIIKDLYDRMEDIRLDRLFDDRS